MSLSRLALRIATVQALRGRTFAGEMVRDSEIGPIDESVEGAEVPFIVVYTDESDADTDVPNEETSLFGRCTTIDLTIEMAVTSRMKGGWGIPSTDAGFEITVDAIERQIRTALSDPDSAWAEFWRLLVREKKSDKSSRGASDRKGVRFAGRQIVLTVDVTPEPTPGTPLRGIWLKFVDLLAADDQLKTQKDLFVALATGGATDWSEFKRLRAALGLSQSTAGALRLGPLPTIAPDAPNFAADVKTDVDDQVSVPEGYVPLGAQ
ncbi:hypothetical protein [Hyphomicrobium sp. MC8b]|uniref:hypothetical protein n=1 Tax=Hyphomicrobium sp. MC8b TaxID=300273 RepID=UPI00391C04D2